MGVSWRPMERIPEGCGGLGVTAWPPGPEHHSWACTNMQRDTWVLVRAL